MGSRRFLRQSRRNPDSSSELDGARRGDRQLTNVFLGTPRLAVDLQRSTAVFFGAQRVAAGAEGVLSLTTR